MTTVHEGKIKLLAAQGDVYYHECPNTTSAFIEVIGDFDGVLTVEGHALQVPKAIETQTWGARLIQGTSSNTITNNGASINNEYIAPTGGQSLRIVATTINSGSAFIRVTSCHEYNATQTGLTQSVIQRSSIAFSQTDATLLDDGSIDSGFIDMADVDKYVISFTSDAVGLNVELVSKSTIDGVEFSSGVGSPFSGRLYLATLPTRDRYIKTILHNFTGVTVTNANLTVKLKYGSSDGASVLPLERSPTDFSGAILTQSVLIGQDPQGAYKNTGVNEAGAILTSEFKVEVARGLYDGYSYGVKFGRVPDVDTASTPEDIYNGGNLYTGFNATGNEEISVTSSDNNDTGSLVSSGTATGGSNTVLIDTGAAFVTDGVAVGDAVLNDTQGLHGIITSVDSETQVTVFSMVDGISETLSNVAGDAYRIATATSTGAGVLKLKSILDEDYVQQEDVYVILNGTTTVTTSGVNAMRCPSGRTIIAGSSGRNEGQLTVTQAVSTTNVFCVIPTFGSTTIGCFTVPAGKDCILTAVNKSITRANGAAGSATIAVNARRFGQAFVAERVYEVNTSSAPTDNTILTFPPATDIKGTVEAVSDNNTIAEIELEYFFIDR